MSHQRVLRLIDIGANLTDGMFKGIYHGSQKHPSDYTAMLTRAREYGVEKMIITGGNLDESREALKISEIDSNLFTTVGCHPTRCNEFAEYTAGADAYLKELSALARDNQEKVVAVGEMGLDYDRLHFCPADTQRVHFERQLALAQETRLPLFLHNRNSINDFIEILSRNCDKFATGGGVVHSFDGTESDLRRILDLGLYVGVNGCSLKNEQNLSVAQLIPDDKLLIETDCPYCEIKQTHASHKHVKTTFKKCKDAKDPLLPVKGRNEPSSLIQILEVLSAVRNVDLTTLAEQVYSNTNKLFFNK